MQEANLVGHEAYKFARSARARALYLPLYRLYPVSRWLYILYRAVFIHTGVQIVLIYCHHNIRYTSGNVLQAREVLAYN